MPRHTIAELHRLKKEKQRFCCLTAYDATQARVLSRAGTEVLLVGDSLAQVVQGRSSTLGVRLDEMVYHTRAVASGNCGSLLMADVPFACAYDMVAATESARRLLRAGAEAVKYEADAEMVPLLADLSRQGIPICAHLGLRPQQAVREGGYRVKGRTPAEAAEMLSMAKECAAAGVCFLLLECTEASLAKRITAAVKIPVIGIGAGADTDAQILVLYDLLGLHPNPPRFVRNFLAGANSVDQAVKNYCKSVREGDFPAAAESYMS